MSMRAPIRIGVSGWTYAPWRSQFFPPKLPQRLELPYAASIFNSIEINGTFYGLQRPHCFGQWWNATPDDFVFAVKASRYITHMLRLRNAEHAYANFFASGPLRLGHKLGPILWQFPPNFRFNPEVMEPFLASLPHDTAAMAEIARHHDDRLRAEPALDPEPIRRVRHAVEIRHESFRDPRFIDLLRRYNVALVCADTVDWPRLMDLTSDFVYCRLHGSVELYHSGYTDEELDLWAERVEAWATGAPMVHGEFISEPLVDGRPRNVFFYFDNTDKLKAPGDAQGLMRRLGVEPAGPPLEWRVPVAAAE